MGELFRVPEDPGYETRAFPGAVVNLDGTIDPQELTAARPTGYLPDARTMPQIPYNRARDLQVPVEYSDARFPVEALDRSELLDQHPMMHVTATITVADDDPRKTGTRDPMISGPARPDTVLLSLFQYTGPGTDNTKYRDVPDGRVFPQYGSQDGSSWTIYQDATASLAGFNDAGQPVPVDPSQTPRAQPTLARMAPGPSHGWTSVPVVNVKQEINTKSTRLLKQQQPPHQDRKANSTVAGQTYGQRTVSVHQAAPAGPAPGADQAWW
jgi:hypothetical protein